ncbi:protein SLOW WALKER 1 [Macadamia integrifolia]|uniref:protein SLOW WALKER 1 n=1 Tax=Macadamia integrifolia TaxID=60698 RepID=UPI001C52E2AF|nr:protein SLOW WALKER 1 [Macadamia integrifolia]
MADVQLGQTFPVKSRLKPTPKKTSSPPESKYWRSFKTQQIPDLVYSITSIDFSPEPPHDFAATFSASVTLYSSQTLEPKFKISSFTDVAYSATFRSDGKLLAAGGESGIVQVFDAKSKSNLHRKLRGHTRPVRLVRYPRFDKLHLFSGSDDSLVKYWDIASETELLSLQGHKDYVRSGFASPASSDMFATGSYDHTVKVWDVRVSSLNSVMEVNHGKPVEDVVFLPSGGLLATAGGNSVKIWDVIAGGKLVHTIESHNKTVTSLCVGKVGSDGGEESEKYRLLSVSLDGFLKVFDYSALKITHSMRYPAPLLSVGFSPDSSVRAIGTSNGILFVGKRKNKQTEIDAPGADKLFGFRSVEEPEKRVLKPTNFRYFRRGQFEKPSEGDYLVKRSPKVKLAEHDKLLRKFRHKEALVSALNGKNPQNVVAVMEELVARKKLLKCVSNLDMEELGLLLGFLQRYVTMPRYSGFLMSLAKKVLELRAEDVSASDLLKGHVRNLKSSVAEEIRTQQSLQEIQGIVSPLMMIAGRR